MENSYGFILNPKAGGGKASNVYPLLKTVLTKKDLKWKIFLTTGIGDGTILAKEAIEEGFNYIISIGGDGTHNEVLNGIIEKTEDKNETNVVMGLIPVGTGGDFQRTLGTRELSIEKHIDLVLHPEKYSAEPQIIDIAKIEATSPIDKNIINSRYFINTSSVGISGAICNGANNSSKALGGFITFCYQTCLQTLKWKNKLLNWKIDDGEWNTGEIYQLIMANGCYCGGGMYVAPHAKLNDGQFGITILTDISALDLMLLPKIYNGTHVDDSKVSTTFGSKVCVEYNKNAVINPNDPTLIEADGEIVGTIPATWEILPNKLSLLYPVKKNINKD